MQTHMALQRYFERKKKSSPGFSMRALARKLNVSPSFLSRVMSGKKPVPDPLLKKLAGALDVEPEFLAVLPQKSRKRTQIANTHADEYEIVKKEAEVVLRNWFYIAILELTTLENYDGSVEMIATRLRLSPTAVEIALRELQAIGLLENKSGRYRKTKSKIRFASAVSTHLIRKFHDDMMAQCQTELRSATSVESFQKRLVTGVTLSCSPEAVQAAKRKLAECLYEIAEGLMASPGTEVYHLAMQLFPLTKC